MFNGKSYDDKVKLYIFLLLLFFFKYYNTCDTLLKVSKNFYYYYTVYMNLLLYNVLFQLHIFLTKITNIIAFHFFS